MSDKPIYFTPPVDGFYSLGGYDGVWCNKDKYDKDMEALKSHLSCALEALEFYAKRDGVLPVEISPAREAIAKIKGE